MATEERTFTEITIDRLHYIAGHHHYVPRMILSAKEAQALLAEFERLQDVVTFYEMHVEARGRSG